MPNTNAATSPALSESSITCELEVFKPEQALVTPKVLLTDTTRYSCATRLAIALARAGIDVSAVLPARGHPLRMTRALREIFPYSGLHPLDSLGAAIQVAAPHFIVPCDDTGVQHLHELHEHSHRLGLLGGSIAALIERSLGAPESYPIVSSRYDLLRIAREEGLCVPDMSPIYRLEDFEAWAACQRLPWVLKVDGTWGGRGVRVAHTRNEAEQFFSRMIRPLGAAHILRRLIVNRDPFPLRPWWNREERRILVQSYIEGRPSNCAVVCKDGRLLAGIAVDVVSSLGPTGPATIVRVVDSPAMLGCAERLAHRLKLTGFFGLDFVIEDGSGDTYLIEMNPRGTPLCHLQLGKGRDMIDALWAQLSNRPPRETPPVTQSDLIAYFPQAWQAIAELPPSSYQDIPPDEPELVREILHPWPDRSLLARAYNQIWECWLRLTSESTPSPTLKG